MGFVDIVIDPEPPDTRTDSMVDAGPGVALEDAHPPAIANATTIVPRMTSPEKANAMILR
jgi:hypothetical protein